MQLFFSSKKSYSNTTRYSGRGGDGRRKSTVWKSCGINGDERKISGRQQDWVFFSFTFWFNFTSAESPIYISHTCFWRAIGKYQCKYCTEFQHLISAAEFKSHPSQQHLPPWPLPTGTSLKYLTCVYKFHFTFDFTSLQPFLFVQCFCGGLFSFFQLKLLQKIWGKKVWIFLWGHRKP